MYVLAAITTASCAAPVQLLDASAILAGMPSTGDFDLPQVDTGLLEQIVPASVPRDFEDGVSNRGSWHGEISLAASLVDNAASQVGSPQLGETEKIVPAGDVLTELAPATNMAAPVAGVVARTPETWQVPFIPFEGYSLLTHDYAESLQTSDIVAGILTPSILVEITAIVSGATDKVKSLGSGAGIVSIGNVAKVALVNTVSSTLGNALKLTSTGNLKSVISLLSGTA
ncbi:hypothetical protein Moror_4721 [Moniliophthora roreri MCA 2997]|uniref:Uncharacterized protein n=1 Tax=Moniliophthora roreri (strain MCA 2997) TaxID=1381753 RepID=V2YKI2_MONRO|nr:hypothetical protein Moror_4721 [Moniliophthora roreri MCA 2997]